MLPIKTPIHLKLEGAGGITPLLDFLNACSALRTCLKHVERCLYGENDVGELIVTDLKKGSAEIAIAPVLESARFQEVSQVLSTTVADLEYGRAVDARLDFTALWSFQQFCSPIQNSTLFELNGTALTGLYVEAIKKILEPIHTSYGSVSGRLEGFSVHGQQRFMLYPSREDEEITCAFENDDLLPRILAAVKSQVTVYGLMHYSLGRAFPTRVEVRDFEKHDPDENLPSLLGMRGVLPSSPPSSDTLRAMRNEW